MSKRRTRFEWRVHQALLAHYQAAAPNSPDFKRMAKLIASDLEKMVHTEWREPLENVERVEIHLERVTLVENGIYAPAGSPQPIQVDGELFGALSPDGEITPWLERHAMNPPRDYFLVPPDFDVLGLVEIELRDRTGQKTRALIPKERAAQLSGRTIPAISTLSVKDDP